MNFYQIRLRGRFDPALAAWFPELSITEEAGSHTLMLGELPDQSALLGILLRLHNLNLAILAVETVHIETQER